MMKLAIYPPEEYRRDVLFDLESPLNRDNCLAAFSILKTRIEAEKGHCNTLDIFKINALQPDVVLFLDIPSFPVRDILGKWDDFVGKWVFLQENAALLPRNWELKNQEPFDLIFTWNDQIVDQKRYVKLNSGQIIRNSISKNINDKKKLCALIAANKCSMHPQELYSKRIEAIRWFEANHPDDFDLYGIGWDEYLFKGCKPIRALNRFKFLKKMISSHYNSYRGPVNIKADVYKMYKFSICYENARDFPGYISEKIFDCFFYGCVPVYWGAFNVEAHIPVECFIDKRKFNSYEKLFAYLSQMSDNEYLEYLDNIEKFLQSDRVYPFSVECFADKIIEQLRNDR